MVNVYIKSFMNIFQLTWYIWLLIFCIGILRLFTPRIKGALGERAVHMFLHSLNPKEYSIIHDVIVEVDGRLTQIDHIVVAKTKIFVIETKNYKGLITGSETAATWTQHLRKKRFSLHNPIRQNYAHIMALSSVLHLPISRFISIIAFAPDAILKVETKTPVVYYNMLPDIIQRNTSVDFTQQEQDNITEMIIGIKQKNRRFRKEQIEQARKHAEV
jgi:hypothetical protein